MNQYIEKLNTYTKEHNEYKIRKYLFKLKNYRISQCGGVDLPTEKKQIIEFILDRFDDSCFERMDGYNDDHRFKNFDHFIKHNKQCVKNLTDNDVRFIMALIEKINKEEIMQCDEENYIEWETFMIYFNIDGKLVTMHPR